jgi:hypothetical protein
MTLHPPQIPARPRAGLSGSLPPHGASQPSTACSKALSPTVGSTRGTSSMGRMSLLHMSVSGSPRRGHPRRGHHCHHQSRYATPSLSRRHPPLHCCCLARPRPPEWSRSTAVSQRAGSSRSPPLSRSRYRNSWRQKQNLSLWIPSYHGHNGRDLINDEHC